MFVSELLFQFKLQFRIIHGLTSKLSYILAFPRSLMHFISVRNNKRKKFKKMLSINERTILERTPDKYGNIVRDTLKCAYSTKPYVLLPHTNMYYTVSTTHIMIHTSFISLSILPSHAICIDETYIARREFWYIIHMYFFNTNGTQRI